MFSKISAFLRLPVMVKLLLMGGVYFMALIAIAWFNRGKSKEGMNPKLKAFLAVPSLKNWRVTLCRSVPTCLGLAYVGLMILSLFTNKLLFLPPDNRQALPSQITRRAADGRDIVIQYLPNPQASYVILFSYGNGEDLAVDQDFMLELKAHGWATCGYDYPGYGQSTGQPSEAGCIAAINVAYDYLTKELHLPAERIILYGRSLGSGPTVDLASRQSVGGMILEGAYLSIYRVVTHFRILPWDVFNNYAKISSIHVPLLSIHAQSDHVIPFWQGQKLYDIYAGPKMHYWVPGADHNTILQVAWDDYWKTIDQFRTSLPKLASLN